MKITIKTIVGLLALGIQNAIAQSALDTVTFAWNPSPTAGIQKYSLYFSQSTNEWTHVKDAGLTLQATVSLPTLGRWFFYRDCNGYEWTGISTI